MAQEALLEDFRRAVEEFNRRVAELGLGDVRDYYWYHTVELPHGLVTPGLYDFRDSLPAFRFPEDMRGMTALDIGSATGFFAFEFEKRGARVISVELPSLSALDRFPGQTLNQVVAKIEAMIFGESPASVANRERRCTAEELYFYLLEGPFQFCRQLLESQVERCYASVYDLSAAKLGVSGFDLVFLGDVLLHTINPLQALAAVARLCSGVLVLSQVIPDDADGRPAMLYIGGDDPIQDDVSWWLPGKACLVQLLKKLGFREVAEVGSHSGVLRPSHYAYQRSILHARK